MATSMLINGVVFFHWLKSKIATRQFLTGRWHGILESDGGDTDILVGDLVVSEHKGKDNTAYFIYRCECTKSNQSKYWGTDKLHEHLVLENTTCSRVWKARFHRFVHRESQASVPSKHTSNDPLLTIYEWACEFESVWFNPKMRVNIAGNGVTFSGILDRQ